jgi:hypothetical protein
MSIGKQKKKKILSPREFLKQSKLQKGRKIKRPPKAKFIGNIYSLSLSEFLHTLFVRNEQIPMGQRMNDFQISQFIQKEYSKHPEVLKDFQGIAGVKKVIFYRNFFNKGILCTKYDYPEYLSFRYDEGKFITSDRSDTVFGDPVEWKLKKGAYYTAHILHQHRVIPDKFKSYEWVQGADNVLVVESLRKLKRYSIAARKRHEDFKRKSKRS